MTKDGTVIRKLFLKALKLNGGGGMIETRCSHIVANKYQQKMLEHYKARSNFSFMVGRNTKHILPSVILPVYYDFKPIFVT